MSSLKIINAKLITPYRLMDPGTIYIKDGRIQEISRGTIDTGDCPVLDAKGLYAAPGFVDIHTHGGGGHDFMDGTAAAYTGAAEMHARHGTTSLVPTTLTSTMEELNNTFQVFKAAKGANQRGAQLLGLHLEGPYFAQSQRGAQDPRYIKNPDRGEYEQILAQSPHIIRWSAAPELKGALALGRELRKRRILPSIAHSDAIYEQVVEAFENGFTHITHLYSGMSGVRRINAYRYAGVIESAYLIDNMTVEIIADGAHLPSSLLKLVYKIKGAEHIALVTDSMRGAGMPDGESILGSLADGQRVVVEEGVAKLMDRTAFAGSVATADRLVRTMITLAEVPLVDAVRMMTATPAAIIGAAAEKGSLAPGRDGDVILMDGDINIHMTMIKGKVVHQSEFLASRMT